MKLWLSNTIQNPKRKFWKCRNNGVSYTKFSLIAVILLLINLIN
jgi:hypothetical protein